MKDNSMSAVGNAELHEEDYSHRGKVTKVFFSPFPVSGDGFYVG